MSEFARATHLIKGGGEALLAAECIFDEREKLLVNINNGFDVQFRILICIALDFVRAHAPLTLIAVALTRSMVLMPIS